MKRKHHLNIFILVVVMHFYCSFVLGADRYSVASGNWSNTATWSASRGGLPGASVPGSADNVFIDDSHEVSVDYNVECNNLTVGFGTGGILNIGRKTTQPTAQSLVAYGDVTVNNGASVIPRRNNEVHSLTVAGNITNGGTLVLSSSTRNGPVCNVTLNATGSITVGGSSPVSFNDLTIEGGCNVTLVSGGHTLYGVLLCNGSMNTQGNLTLISTSLSTALVDGSSAGTVSGALTMERYIASAFGYKYFSSPFKDATVGGFADDIDLASAFPSLYSYEEESLFSGWTVYTTETNILNPLEGYAANLGTSSLPLTVELSGEVNSGPLQVTMYNHNNPSTQGYSLAGNPYPSPVDWNSSGWTKTNIDDALWYFRASATDQYGGSYSSYVNGVSSDGNATNIIPSMQGFFVHVTDGTYPVAATLGVNNGVRVNDLTHEFLKSAPAVDRVLLRVSAAFAGDTASADPVAIYFDELATVGYDSQYDALKMLNTDWMMINLYSVSTDGRSLSINGLPPITETTTIIPLTILTYIDGEVEFTLKDKINLPESSMVMLNDNSTGKETNIGETKARITLGAGEYTDRFSIFIKNATSLTETVSEDKDPLFTAYATRDLLKVKINELSASGGKIDIYDVNGSKEYTFSVFGPGYYEFGTDLHQGIYIVRYSSGAITESKKIFIRQ